MFALLGKTFSNSMIKKQNIKAKLPSCCRRKDVYSYTYIQGIKPIVSYCDAHAHLKKNVDYHFSHPGNSSNRDIGNSAHEEHLSSTRKRFFTKQFVSNCFQALKQRIQSCFSTSRAFWNMLCNLFFILFFCTWKMIFVLFQIIAFFVIDAPVFLSACCSFVFLSFSVVFGAACCVAIQTFITILLTMIKTVIRWLLF